MAATWTEFERSAPEIAAAGHRLLEDAPGIPGVAFLATVGNDSTPRIHPFIPAVCDGRLWAFVVESPKQRDLERTGQHAIHSRLGDRDESFTIAGTASRRDHLDDRDRVGDVMPYSDIDEHHVLYEFALVRALWTTWTTPTTPVHHRWIAPAS